MEPEPVAAPAPAERGGVRVIHQRANKGRRLPEHVSATWVGSGDGSALQVMVTGLRRACEPEPAFSAVVVDDVVRLVELPFEAVEGCSASHTLMLQLDHQEPRDLEVEVLRAGGASFGTTKVAATDH